MPETNPHEPTAATVPRRHFLRGALATAGLVAISLDWPETIQSIMEHFRDPTIKADPQSVPADQPIYKVNREETAKLPVTETLFSSAAEFLLAADKIEKAQSIEELRAVSQTVLFDKIGANVAFGQSNQPDKWQAYAQTEAQRITGIPVDKMPESMRDIQATYGMPDLEAAKFAILRTQIYAAAVPLAIHRATNLSECGYVAGMSIHNAYYDATIDNGITDTIHGGVMLDCMEGTERRRSVGSLWMRQDSKLVDVATSRSPTTFNDPEFAKVIPGMENVSQHRLDYPRTDDKEVFDIANIKADRFTEIFTGRMILPGDEEFYTPQQVQQEVLLRRLYGTFPEIPSDYFENLTLYRREHDRLPTWGGELG